MFMNISSIAAFRYFLHIIHYLWITFSPLRRCVVFSRWSSWLFFSTRLPLHFHSSTPRKKVSVSKINTDSLVCIIVPFTFALSSKKRIYRLTDRRTDGQTDRRTDGQTNSSVTRIWPIDLVSEVYLTNVIDWDKFFCEKNWDNLNLYTLAEKGKMTLIDRAKITKHDPTWFDMTYWQAFTFQGKRT